MYFISAECQTCNFAASNWKIMETNALFSVKEQLEEIYKQSLEHTKDAIEYMAQFNIKPDGKVGLFFPPSIRQKEIDRLPFEHGDLNQVNVYETAAGEFSARCPFSGIPDYGVLRIEYAAGSYIIELKSLKYYILSWRDIGSAQENITSIIYKDLLAVLEDPKYLLVTTIYNVRGGINTTCSVDSRNQ